MWMHRECVTRLPSSLKTNSCAPESANNTPDVVLHFKLAGTGWLEHQGSPSVGRRKWRLRSSAAL